MRHGDKINNLGRKTAHRHALLMNLACALIDNKRIFTTLAKAKALRTFVEPIITKSKEDTTHSRRIAFSYLKRKETVSELFKEVATKVANRNGGYTRIIKTGNRQGDAAEMAMIELVDFNELYSNNKSATETTNKKSTRRSRASKKSKSEDSSENN
jgi:large subunit ribosomal protein L17